MMNRYKKIIIKQTDFDDVVIKNAPIKERILLSYVQETKTRLKQILDIDDELVIKTQLLGYFKQWGFPQFYTAFPNSEIVKLLCDLAEIVCQHHNEALETEEHPKSALEVLMPHLHLTSNHIEYPNLCAFEKPIWDEALEKELSQLEEKIALSGLPMQEEAWVLSEEETACLNLHTQTQGMLIFYGKEPSDEKKLRIEQLTREIEQLNASDLFIHVSKKQQIAKNIQRVKILNEKKRHCIETQKKLDTGHMKEHGHEVYPILNLTEILNTHILDASHASLIPISVLLQESSSIRPYQDIEVFACSPQSLEDENIRLVAHSAETLAVRGAKHHLDALKSDQSHLLGHLMRLCKHLRKYDAHGGIGRQEQASHEVYECIRQFSAYYETLGYQLRKYTDDASLEEGFIYLMMDFDAKNKKFKLSYTIKSNDNIIKDTINNETSLELETKIQQKMDKREMTPDDWFEELKDLKEQILSITHNRQHTSPAQEKKHNIPKPLREEIEKLLELSKNPALNKAIYRETCIGTRREKLEEAMLDEELLASITTASKELQANLLREAIDDVQKAKHLLQESLAKKAYKGADKLLLSQELLQRLNIHLEFKKPSDLRALMQLDAEEIRTLGAQEGGNEILADLIHSFDGLDSFIHKYPYNKLEAIFAITKPHLLKRYENMQEAQNILTFLTMGEKWQVLAKAIYQYHLGPRLLFALIHDPIQFKEMLQSIPGEQRFLALSTEDGCGYTVLQKAATQPILLQTILNLLPLSQHPEIIKCKDRYQKNMLHQAANEPDLLEVILNALPENERLTAVKNVMNKEGYSVLHMAAKHYMALQMILDLLPKDERSEAVQAEDKFGNTLLYQAVDEPMVLQLLLGLYPEDKRLDVIKKIDSEGQTLLHKALDNPVSLLIILNFLPPNQRWETLQEKNTQDETVLYRARNKPVSLQAMLNALPQEQHIEAVKLKEASQDTLSPLFFTMHTDLGTGEQASRFTL